jgi:hypothetical protein
MQLRLAIFQGPISMQTCLRILQRVWSATKMLDQLEQWEQLEICDTRPLGGAQMQSALWQEGRHRWLQQIAHPVMPMLRRCRQQDALQPLVAILFQERFIMET